MPTPPTNPKTNSWIKERICVYGGPGIGKTHLYFTIAKWHQEMGSDAKFYGINTDSSYEVLSMNPEFENLNNIEWTDVVEFEDYMRAAKQYYRVVRPQDWISADLLNTGWRAVQTEYAQALAKELGIEIDDMGDLWKREGFSGKKGSTSKYPIKGWDWGMPNARYFTLVNNYIRPGNGHRFIVCGEQELMKESKTGDSDEDPRIKAMFKHLGVKPQGQKDDPFQWHTILHLDSKDIFSFETVMSTAKERWGGRRRWGTKMSNGMVRDEPMKDFFMDYLVDTAGWKMD